MKLSSTLFLLAILLVATSCGGGGGSSYKSSSSGGVLPGILSSSLSLSSPSDLVVEEQDAINTIDINNGSGDVNAAGEPITYSCYYDTNAIDGVVAQVNSCSSLAGLSFDSATGVLSWRPDSLSGDSSPTLYEFSVIGSDGTRSASTIFNVTVTNHTGVKLDPIADTAITEGDNVNFDAADGGDDVGGSTLALTYTCTFNGGTNCSSLPGTASFNASTGVLDWTADYTAAATGTFTVTINGTDGSLNDDEVFVITVAEGNQPPVLDAIGDETVSENSAITTVNAADGGDDFDVDAQALTYTCTYNSGTNCSSLPGAVTFTASTGVLDWTPDYTAAATGTFNFTISGSDGSASDDELFTITVNNTNQAPVLDAIGDETVNEGAAITTANAADGGDDFDADSQAITYTCTFNGGTNCTSLPGSVTFTAGTGVLDWTPDYTAAATGTFTITINGSDGSLNDDEILVITVNDANQPPTLDAIGDETVSENSAITTVNAADGADDFDADAQAITYTCSFNGGTNCTSLPGAVSFAAATGILDWTPDYTAAATGTFNFTINGSDGTDSDDELFTITVNNTNQAPVLDAIGDETVSENSAITTVNAADGADDFDADAQAITYTCTYNGGTNCTSLPGSVTFTGSTGVLDWTPDYTAAATGTFNFTINGSDGTASDDELFTITVNNTNQAPVLDAIGDETVDEGVAIATVNAADGSDDFDADSQAITYTCSFNGGTNCTSLPGTVSFTAGTGVLDWTPDYTAAATGTFTITINGSDGSLNDDEVLVITVNNVAVGPVLDAIGNETVSESSAITQINAADGGNDLDGDGDTITYVCYYDKNAVDGSVASTTTCASLGATFNASTGVMDWTPSGSDGDGGPDQYEFRITGTATGGTDDELFVITVNDAIETGFYKIAVGEFAACGLTAEGKAYCWGDNTEGQVGDASTTQRTSPVAVSTTLRFTDITMGGWHTCALTEGGDIYCWGYDAQGTLGDGAGATSQSTPVLVDMSAHGTDTKFKSLGYTLLEVQCGISIEGNVYCWGDGTNKALGDGGTTDRFTPVKVDFTAFSTDLRAIKVVSGREQTCTLMHDGTVYCWGRNSVYELGQASSGTAHATPVQVNITSNLFRDIAAFHSGICGITNSGGAECWGSGWDGELGSGTSTYAYSAIVAMNTTNLAANEVFRKIDGGKLHACGITNFGNVFCWGQAKFIGTGLSGTTIKKPTAITSTLKFIDIAAGANSTTAIASDGKAYSWGIGTGAQIGDGGTANRFTPVAVDMTAVVAGASILGFQKIDVKSDNSASSSQIGLTSNGLVFELGTTTKVSMAAHSPDTGLMDIDAGADHSCALSAQGNVYCWGDNTNGELGDGSTTTSATPVLVDMSAFPTDASFIQVSAGTNSSCGLTSLGNAYCWGDNTSSKLGDGTSTQRLTPVAVDVSGLTGTKGKFIYINASGDNACAVNAEGEAYCWGDNSNGTIGDGTTTGPRTTPTIVSTANMGTDVRVVTVHPASTHMCVLSSQRKIYCTGTADQIGDNAAIDRTAPYPIDYSTIGTTYFTAAKTGTNNGCGLTVDGKIYCWGTNTNGQIGDGSTATSLDPALFDMVAFGSENLFSGLSVGDDRVCGSTPSGKVYCSGNGFSSPANEPNAISQTLP